MDTVGYCTIKKDATTGKGTDIKTFLGADVRVMEFARDGGVLVVNCKATGMAMFDKEDVVRKFECGTYGEYITPPNLNPLEQMAYMTKLITRKGGFNNLVRSMVIQASLHKGKFTDDFLFQKELEENFQRSKLTKDEIKIMDLEQELKKHTNPEPYSRRRKSNPRRLRRQLRRLRSKESAPDRSK